MMVKKLHDKELFMNWLKQEIKKNFEGHSQVCVIEIENILQDLTEYFTAVFKPIEEALGIVEKSFYDFIIHCKSGSYALSKLEPKKWFYDYCWKKIVEKSVKNHERNLINYTRTRLKHPHMAEDVVQDTFKRLYNCKPREIRKDVTHWLYTTCRNRAVDINRRTDRSVPYDINIMESTLESPYAKPDQIAAVNDDYSQLIKFLEKNLNETQLQLLKLKFEKQMSSREIAASLNLSENYVRKALCITLMSVRKKVNEKE